MVYYISNPAHRQNAIVDCEYFWKEEYSNKSKKYEWYLDVKTTIIAENLLEEIYPKIKSGEFTEERIKELTQDISKLRDLRTWLWEKSDVNRTLDRNDPNTKASSDAHKKGDAHIEEVLTEFAQKWGYELYED